MADDPILPTFADIEAAARRIAPHAVRTPLIENPALSERVGARVFLKPETLQRTGSFKFRGACNRLSLIPDAERKNGVVAFSSGNHAQGVAAAATLFGMQATIVMPADAPKAKLEGTRKLGAMVVTYDRYRDDREAIAATIQAERGATLVKPFDDAFIVAGQGTIGLEIAADLKEKGLVPDLVFVPCGGGGLVTGTALALSTTAPGAKIVAVEPQNYDGMGRSLRGGARTPAPANTSSIADSLMAPQPGIIPFALARRYLFEGIALTDAEMERAVSYAFRTLKLVVEPGGSAALAAILAEKVEIRGKTIVAILSGGNCDLEVFQRCCERVPHP
jgi:threonine dehydratase